MKLKEIAKQYRPRERLLRYGVRHLSDSEIMAIILCNGHKNENAIDMSNRLLAEFGIQKLKELSIRELETIKGIGKAKAMQIMAIFELYNRHSQVDFEKKTINCAQDVHDYVIPELKELDREHFQVLLLDTKNRVIKHETVSIGTLNTSLAHPREIFKKAIRYSCNSVIIVHNHPSGDVTPSKEDIEVTERLMEAGELLGITVLDHVIVGGGYWSYKEENS